MVEGRAVPVWHATGQPTQVRAVLRTDGAMRASLRSATAGYRWETECERRCDRYWPAGAARELTQPWSSCNPPGFTVCGVAVVDDFGPDPGAGTVVVVVLDGVDGTVVEGMVVVVVTEVGTVIGGTLTAGTVVGMVLVVVVVVVVVGGTVVVVVVGEAAAGAVVFVVAVLAEGDAVCDWPEPTALEPGVTGAATVMTAVVHAPAFCIVATSSTSRASA